MRVSVVLVACFLFLRLGSSAARAQEVSGKSSDTVRSTAEQAFAAGATLSLDEVITEGLRRNPGVQSALHAVAAQRHKVPQAKSLADPQVSVGWAGNIAPFSLQDGDPSSYRGVGVSQQIPYPGKL